MILTCHQFQAQMLPTGRIQLVLDQAEVAPADDRLSLKEVAALLKKTVKAIDKLSRRKKDPLPIRRGKGRPFGFRTEIDRWLSGTASRAKNIIRVYT